MNNLIDFISGVPLPSVITLKDGTIKCYNSLFFNIFYNFKEESKISSLFEQWKDQGNNAITVFVNQREYLLIHKMIKLDSQEWLFYFMLEDSYFMHLMRKIEKLDNLNNELDAIIENSSDGITVSSRDGTILRTNQSIESVTGIPQHYYIGKNIFKLTQKGLFKESTTLLVINEKKPVTVLQNNFMDKETLVTARPIFNKDGEVEKVVNNIRDISELNRLYKELKDAVDLNQHYKKEINKLKIKTRLNIDYVVASKQMENIFEMVERIAKVDATVLILGETGVGKDVLAHHIYIASDRQGTGEFIKVNCGAIPNELLESELFGYEAGAFTGANRGGKKGMFELAHNGVLFLDEVGDLPLNLQVKLLRVLQEKKIQRIGAVKQKEVDVRLIAATNRNLREMVKNGEFREDLYYRLNVIPIEVPPLRERREDVIPLVQFFLNKNNEKYKISKEFNKELKDFLQNYDWPGNVRELSNLVERLTLIVPSRVVSLKDLPPEYDEKVIQPTKEKDNTILSLKEATEMAEKTLLKLAVERYDSTYEIAEKLQSSQATIVRKLKRYNLRID